MFIVIILVILLSCSHLWALPTTAYDAEKVVAGWLRADPQPLDTALGKRVTSVETFTNDDGEPIYHIVYLHPCGFVIVAADDQVEPIVGFADDGTYDPTPDNPLRELATHDLNGRIAAVRRPFDPLATTGRSEETKARNKWDNLIYLATASNDEMKLMGMPPIIDGHPSDLRVAPLLKSLWGQTCCDGPGGQPRACYNYFTPQFLARISFIEGDENNYPCGCVATTMAQIMQYHRHPREPVEPAEFTIIVDRFETNRSLLRGQGPGGAYNWEDMVDEPGPGTTDAQRRAIGALCHDAGISVGTEYTPEGSGAYLYDAATALVDTFQYGNAVWGEDAGNIMWRQDLVEMMNPNLDAGLPVQLGFRDSERLWRGHTAVCDGYGYNLSTPYYHLNMGWDGQENCWYNLPDINCPTAAGYNIITRCIYNIFPDGRGEIISGRIINSEGRPFGGVAVTAKSESGADVHTAITNDRGIYTLKGVHSNTKYIMTANKPGYDFELNVGYDSEPNVVTTGMSVSGNSSAGNRWGINFVGYDNGGGESQVVSSDVKLVADDGERDDHFGCSVSIDGDYAIVGAYGDDSKRGAAYIFKREGRDWIQQAKIRAPITQRERDGYFGFNVSISGDYAIVGAGIIYGQRSNGFGTFSANIFKRDGTTWKHQTALGTSYPDKFGCSVSISGDYAIVGAPYSDMDTGVSVPYDWGAAHIFSRSGSEWIWETRLLPVDARARTYFGGIVSIEGDYVITANGNSYRNEEYGPVYIFKRENTGWIQQAMRSSHKVTFGRSLAVSADYAVIGSPDEGTENGIGIGAIYVLKREGTTWIDQAKLIPSDGFADRFGHSVSLGEEYIIVGAPESNDDYMGRDSGSAFIFKRGQAGWMQQAKLTALDGAYEDHFGHSVSIDGDYVIVGAPEDDDNGKSSGSAYIFKRIGSTWSP